MENIKVFPMVYKHRINKAGEVPLVICVTLERKPVAYDNLKKRILLTDWDEVKKEVRTKAPNATLLNALIKKRVSELDGEFTRRQVLGKPLTTKKIKDEVAGKKPSKSFYEFCEAWLPKKYKNRETLRTYNNEITKLKVFQEHLDFADITFEFLSSYKSYLIDTLKNKPNTYWKTFKFINTMVLDGIKHECLDKEDNPFKTFDRGRYKDPEKDCLDLDDCDRLEKLTERNDLPQMLKDVTAYFLLSAYCGLRFEDAINFDPAQHIFDDRLVYETTKFNVVVRMKLYPRLEKIVSYITDNRLKITNQTFNKWLKVAFTMAGLPESMASSHNGRHLFGGTLAEAGVSKEKAQKLLGHKDIASTNVYYHIKNKALDNAIDQVSELGGTKTKRSNNH